MADMVSKGVRTPFGNASAAQALTATGAQAITVSGQTTFIDGATVQATGNRTLNLTIDSTVLAGATLQVTSKSAGTETLTFGTGIDAAVITGVAGKTFSQAFVYAPNEAGTLAFLPLGSANQID
jgi:hypothetical protein